MSSHARSSGGIYKKHDLTTARRSFGLIAALLLLAAAPARSGTVAHTFDDVPVFGAFTSAADGRSVTDQLLAGLARHHWRATAFVNEVQLEGPDKPERTELLDRWLDAGIDLGNHTYSHVASRELLDLPGLPPEARVHRRENGRHPVH